MAEDSPSDEMHSSSSATLAERDAGSPEDETLLEEQVARLVNGSKASRSASRVRCRIAMYIKGPVPQSPISLIVVKWEFSCQFVSEYKMDSLYQNASAMQSLNPDERF